MTKKYWETEEFKDLERVWKEKLIDSGFVDVEEAVAGERLLKFSSAHIFRDARGQLADSLEVESKRRYYELLAECTAKEEFLDSVDKLVLVMRSEGTQIKDISKEVSRHRQTIRFIIRKYENKWGIKKWTAQKLNPPWKNGKKKPTR